MKNSIRELVTSYGADLCGFANIDRFWNAPEGFCPSDLFAGCKTVISIGFALPRGLAKVSPRLVYGHFNNLTCSEVDRISFLSSKKIEETFHCAALPVPCDSPYECWDSDTLEGKGLLSMKHMAVQAGLGTLGKSALFLNGRFGSMLTLGAILTDLDLPSDEPAKSICVECCKKCVESCPAGAISGGKVNQKACRQNTYGKTARGFDTVDCNLCRTVCPVSYGSSHKYRSGDRV